MIMKTTLGASLGAICYLRRLLPDDSFSDTYMTDSIPFPGKSADQQYQMSQPDPNGSQQPGGGKGFRYPRIKGDGSPEGAKILKFVEEGVMDAVSKGYLRSFMFIIFLDKNDPQNIVESYTFNFFYSGPSNIPSIDMMYQVADKVSSTDTQGIGGPRTHQDVRRSVKTLMKTLILSCQKLIDLPRQRYVDFKLSYNENAPKGYEAPGFRDCTEDPLFMCTSDKDTEPTDVVMGKTTTGSHGVSVTTQSIVQFLPARTDSDERRASGEKDDPEKERAEQLKAAEKRKVAWSADLPVYDRKAYERPDDVYDILKRPLGTLLADGNILPFPMPGPPSVEENVTGKKRAHQTVCEFQLGYNEKLTWMQLEEEIVQLSQTQVTQPPASQARHASSGASIARERSKTDFDFDADGETDYCGSMAIIPLAPAQTALRHSNGSASTIFAHQDGSASEDRPSSNSAAMTPEGDTNKTQECGALRPKSANQLSERPRKAQRTNNKSGPTETDQANKENADVMLKKPSKSKAPKVKADKPLKSASSSKPNSRSRSSATPTNTPQKSKDSTPRKRATPPARRMLARTAEAARTSSLKKKSSRKIGPRTDTHLVEANEDKINCFCGAEDEQDGSMQCDGCRNWVHCPCVGFSELKAAAQVDNWYCLICKMERIEGQKWTKLQLQRAREGMSKLALFRRALLSVRQQGGIGKAGPLRDALGCSVNALAIICKQLYSEGFIDAPFGSRKKKGAFYKWVQSPEINKRFLGYFEPNGSVERELFELYKDQSSEPMEEDNEEPSSQATHVNPDADEVSVPKALTSSLAPPNTIKTPFGTFIPSLDGQPISLYSVPAIRSSRAESPIKLLEDW
ncbi:hypothetical protein AYX15_04104 [Cryptococcus neoformans]|nr:hypothetical protein AYX15_04104 [Cryptococcus neoformans var. grubii]